VKLADLPAYAWPGPLARAEPSAELDEPQAAAKDLEYDADRAPDDVEATRAERAVLIVAVGDEMDTVDAPAVTLVERVLERSCSLCDVC